MNAWLTLAVTLVAELYVLRRLRFDRLTVAIVLMGTLWCFHYLGYTSVTERNYDAESHIEYLETIAASGRLPKADACGACGHPPLYYAVAAGWVRLVGVGGATPLEQRLQWLSLLLFFGFVVVALLIFRSCGVRPWALRFAAALVAFWPSGIINSVRVHNDALASLLMLTAMYFLAQWDRRGRALYFYLALAASALALLTKASGYSVATAVVLFAALRAPTTKWGHERLQRCLTAVLVLATAAALATGGRESRRPRTVCQEVLGTACDGRYVPSVPDRPSRFVYFDVVDFVSRMDTITKAPERDYFLNRLGKSSLFGVMPLGEEFASKRHEALAALMSVLLLVMVAVCAVGLLFLRGPQLRKYRVYVGTSALMFAFLVAFRVRAPNQFHEDFRHIFPVLVPFCLGYTVAVERAGRYRPALRVAGLAIGATLAAASALFFVRLA
jgi:4-amino-4-deoxy-L-arabinose transferase-like glycosyltransferase